MSTKNVNWQDAVKKEARGENGYDLGEVQDTATYYIHTQKGIERKTQYYIPKKLFKNYDGHKVTFNVNENDAKQFIGEKYPSDQEYTAKYEPQTNERPMAAAAAAPKVMHAETGTDIVERIPLMTENLQVTKHRHEDEVVITKVPYTETLTRDVDVMHEEVHVEEVKPSANTKVPEMRKDMTQETIRIPVAHEDVDVSKTPAVREEVIIHKAPVTETRHISETIRSEKFEVSDKTRNNAFEEEKKKHPTA